MPPAEGSYALCVDWVQASRGAGGGFGLGTCRAEGRVSAWACSAGSRRCAAPPPTLPAPAVNVPQGDPFASPSRCRVLVPAGVAALPAALLSSRTRRTAVADFLTRSFGAAVSASGEKGNTSGGGRDVWWVH